MGVGLMKNAAGIYGILAVLSVFLHPFLRIAVHYMFLKFTSGLCYIFGSKSCCNLVESFSAAMGLLLGMTASGCFLILISTVCFMKGVS